MIYYFHYQTPLGPMILAEENGALVAASLDGQPPKGALKEKTKTLEKAVLELREYLYGKRHYFDLPLNPAGTSFQKTVWDALSDITYGQTGTYQEIARNIDKPRACRAVGMANHQNPLLIFVPCHRVIGSDGSLTGYAGGLHIKKHLLDLEKTVYAQTAPTTSFLFR